MTLISTKFLIVMSNLRNILDDFYNLIFKQYNYTALFFICQHFFIKREKLYKIFLPIWSN